MLLWTAAQSSTAAPQTYPQCEHSAADDGRPYTLCVSETDYEIAEARLNRQLQQTLAYARRNMGMKARKQLLSDQRAWLRNRDREYDAVAASSPVTPSGRNQMSCLAQITNARTAELLRMAHQGASY